MLCIEKEVFLRHPVRLVKPYGYCPSVLPAGCCVIAKLAYPAVEWRPKIGGPFVCPRFASVLSAVVINQLVLCQLIYKS